MPNAPKELVEQVRRRLRAFVFLREMSRYAVYAAIIALFLCVLSKFIHPLNKWHISAGIIFIGILTGLIVASVKKVTVLDAAMVADLNGKTGETLTIYLEMEGFESDFHPMIKANADAASKELNPARILPYHMPRSAKYLLIALLFTAGLFFVPAFKYPQQKKREQNILELAEAAKTLDKASRILKETKIVNPEVKELQKQLQELQIKIRQGELDRKKAMAEMKKISDKLETMLHENYSKKAEVEKTTDKLSGNEDTKKLADAMKKGDKKGIAEETEKLAKNVQKMQSDLGSKDAKTMEAAQKKIDDLKNTLVEAKKGMESGKANQDMQKVLDMLDKLPLGNSAKGIPKEMLDELAKNMSKSLQDMLDKGNLSKDDLEKMMQAFKEMADAEEDARCGKSGEG